uniref:Uncharacterized protein n=1 Tax=Ignisphaera aggregans TaxID=334771 RepID=A0A7J2U2Z7_9CREN
MDTLIISKIHKVSAHGKTLYVTIPRSCHHIVSSAPVLYAYIADGDIVYSTELPANVKSGSVLVAGERIVLLPTTMKSTIYRVKVSKINRDTLGLRIPATIARILGISAKSLANIICFDNKIVVKLIKR